VVGDAVATVLNVLSLDLRTGTVTPMFTIDIHEQGFVNIRYVDTRHICDKSWLLLDVAGPSDLGDEIFVTNMCNIKTSQITQFVDADGTPSQASDCTNTFFSVGYPVDAQLKRTLTIYNLDHGVVIIHLQVIGPDFVCIQTKAQVFEQADIHNPCTL